MRKYITLALVAAGTAAATPAWQYEGLWPPEPHRKLLRDGVGIASPGDYEFYVTDALRENSRVWHVTASNATWWGGYGSEYGKFSGPNGVALAPNGNVYVVDAGNFRVQYFTPAGSFLGAWATSGETELLGAGKIAVAPNGNVYVTHVFGRFVSYYTSTGSFLGSWGSRGSGPGQFENPHGIAVSAAYVVYVVDAVNNNVQYFTTSGSYLGRWGGPGGGPGQFIVPVGVAVAPDGSIFVTDAGNNRVQYFTSTGSYLGQWGTTGKNPGQFNYPSGIALSPSGPLAYVVDSDNWRVQWFRETLTDVTPASLGRVKALFR